MDDCVPKKNFALWLAEKMWKLNSATEDTEFVADMFFYFFCTSYLNESDPATLATRHCDTIDGIIMELNSIQITRKNKKSDFIKCQMR